MKFSTPSRHGFTLIELMVALAVGSGVLLAIYRLYVSNQTEVLRLKGKIEARNQLALSAKKLSSDITMAGLGMHGAPAMAKGDAVGSDTLTLYANTRETSSKLEEDTHPGSNSVQVQDIGTFAGFYYVGISNGTSGELFRVTGRSGNTLNLYPDLKNSYSKDSAIVVPVDRRKYYTDQTSEKLVCISSQGTMISATHVHNFQVSFRDQDGSSTEDLTKVRSVEFSITGVFAAKAGTINSIVFSNSAIPRNLL